MIIGAVAILVGVCVTLLGVWLLRAPADWLSKSSAKLGTRIDAERYSVGYNGARIGIPMVIMLCGVLIAVAGLSSVV